MNESKPDTKKKTRREGETNKPAHVVRQGAVAASIWLKQSTTGYYYYDFSLSRSWKSVATGKMGYSNGFFERHRDDLIQVIMGATAWIEDKVAHATTTFVDATNEAA